MKRILVPTDFSPSALSALNYAADLALAIDASLVMLHVYDLPVSSDDLAMPMLDPAELEQIADIRLSELRESLEHITPGKLNIHTETRMGDPREEIQAACSQHAPFLVVIGTTGHSGIDRVLFGSTSLGLIRELSWPLLAVPRGTEYGTGIHKIGLTWDFTQASQTLPFDILASVIHVFKAHLEVLHVATDLSNDRENQVHPLVQELLKPLNPVFHNIEHADVAEGINAFAEKNNFDLLINVPRAHTFFQSLFNKSSTADLVKTTHLPVLFIHA